MSLTLPKAYLSPSQITTYMQCPRLYYWRYVLGEIAPPRGATVQGTATHRAAQAALIHRMTTGERMSTEEVQDAAAGAFDAGIPEADLAIDEEQGALKDEAVGLAALWLEKVEPLLHPVAVEERWEIEVDGIPVVGYMDVREEDGICDLKTVGRSPEADQAEKSVQFALYAIAGEACHGMFAPEIRADYLVKNKTPKHIRQALTLPEGRLAAAEDAVVEVAEAVSAGRFPRNPSSHLCNARQCPFYPRCWTGERSRTVTVTSGVGS